LVEEYGKPGVLLSGWQACYESIPKARATVLSYEPALIIASDRWLQLDALDDKGQELVAGSPQHLDDMELRTKREALQLVARGSTLVLVHQAPLGIPTTCTDPSAQNDPACHAKASDDLMTPKFNAVLDRVAAADPQRIKTLDFQDVVCPDDVCSPRISGVWIRYDRLHYTEEAARWLLSTIEQRLRHVGVPLDR
jgi:hypothetical protein